RPDARTLGVLGSGVLARYTVLAIRELLPEMQRVYVYSRDRERREAYARQMAEATGWSFVPVDTARAAVEEADILVTATNSAEPNLFAEWIKPGTHINAMGIKTEIHPDVFRGARVYGDSKDVAIEDGKFSIALKAGAVTASDLAGEIGDVLIGRAPGRASAEEITIFDSSGLAVQDIICAQYVYRQAGEQNAGTYIDLGLDETP
ncbi:MAG TPA: ornithine cyclodeaminase family protein, partial [Herpetosiphonaceae bacterium]|nr:ornithine cyclodeaminase family protein [Herpetosiphonaceae bacterium]